jgi:hypothetical protein
VLVALALPVGLTSVARAEPPSAAAVADAGKHFQRGVTMYNEADYRAALVEFRRAYEVTPNPAVLYNIGQTYYQLQNYAAALVALGRYLTEAGQAAPHRREVEQTIDTLQTRVGKVAVTTTQPGCDITVDDEFVGKTPLDEPVLVSIGRRKITALRDARPTESRFVDVAAGDTVKVTLSGAETSARTAAAPASGSGDQPTRRNPITTGWYVTGGLGTIAVVAGVAAFVESRSLQSDRDKLGAKASDLSSKGSWVTRLSLTADITGLAAIIVGGITFKYSLAQSGSHEAHVAISPTGVQIAGKF